MSSIIRATTTSGLQVAPDNSGSLQLQTNGTTTAVTIDTSQNVGIGTTSPSKKLDVNGEAKITTGMTLTPVTSSLYATDSTLSSYATDNAVYLNGHNTGWLALQASGTQSCAIQLFGASYAEPNKIAFKTSSTERMRIDSSGNLLFNSGYGSVATAYGCRAWVNFNGTGTVAIRASGNVTSITDNGTGDYTVNFTNAMPDANYSVSAILSNSQTVGNSVKILATNNTASPTTMTTAACRLVFVTTTTAEDYNTITAMFVR